MLVITRQPRKGFSLTVNGLNAHILFDSFSTDSGARICIDAPKEVQILRDEIKYEDAKKGDFRNTKPGNATLC